MLEIGIGFNEENGFLNLGLVLGEKQEWINFIRVYGLITYLLAIHTSLNKGIYILVYPMPVVSLGYFFSSFISSKMASTTGITMDWFHYLLLEFRITNPFSLVIVQNSISIYQCHILQILSYSSLSAFWSVGRVLAVRHTQKLMQEGTR